MPEPIIVTYPMDKATWNIVVVEGKEERYVASEGQDKFEVEYPDQDEFNKALNRFDGMIEYSAVYPIAQPNKEYQHG